MRASKEVIPVQEVYVAETDTVHIRLWHVEGIPDDDALDLEIEISHEHHAALRSGLARELEYEGRVYEFKAVDLSEVGKIILEFVPLRQ
jgi:hypothetical protein